jgi:hypothetical protein
VHLCVRVREVAEINFFYAMRISKKQLEVVIVDVCTSILELLHAYFVSEKAMMMKS